LEATPNRKKEETSLLYVGVEKSHLRISLKEALWKHRAVLMPKTPYASVVWWPMVSRVEAKNLLQSLHGSYLRVAVWYIKSTPTDVLQVALC
jgi:hypothetical protein